jgi:hypothetical protein
MKRFLTGVALTTGFAATATAHTLPIQDGIVRAVDHQLFGWHHLPTTILLIVIGAAMYYSRRRSEKKR